jgi:zinc transporter ZupT
MNPFVTALIVAIVIAILTSWLGVWIVNKRPKWFSENLMNLVIAGAAGFLLALAFTEFLPHAVQGDPINSGILILVGVVVIFLAEVYGAPLFTKVDQWAFKSEHPGFHDHYGHSEHECQHHDHAHPPHKLSPLSPPKSLGSDTSGGRLVLTHTHAVSPAAACSAVGCLMVCTFFDGIEIAAAFRIGGDTGWLTVVGLFFHILPDGLIVASLGIASKLSLKFTRLLAVMVGSSLVLGVLVAALTSSFIPRSAVISLSTGILIYVSFMHLLPVVTKTRRGVLMFLLALIAYSFLISTFHNHH